MKIIRLAILVVLASATLAACDNAVEPPALPEAPPETVIVVDDLDDENGGEGHNNWTDLEHFNVVEGCVDLHGNGFVDVQPGNGLYIDMDGSCQNAGTLETKETFTFEPGEEYLLEMWLAGNNRWETRDSMDVTIGDFFSEQFNLGPNEEFALYTRRFEVAEEREGKLRLEHYGGDDQGILVDLVRIRRNVD